MVLLYRFILNVFCNYEHDFGNNEYDERLQQII